MGCQNTKPSSQKNINNQMRNRKEYSQSEGIRSRMQTIKRNQQKSQTNQIDFTVTLQQLQNIRDGLQNMPLMPLHITNTDSIIEYKDKKVIERHFSGQIISLQNSQLFQRRKTQLSSISCSNSCNVSVISKQQ